MSFRIFLPPALYPRLHSHLLLYLTLLNFFLPYFFSICLPRLLFLLDVPVTIVERLCLENIARNRNLFMLIMFFLFIHIHTSQIRFSQYSGRESTSPLSLLLQPWCTSSTSTFWSGVGSSQSAFPTPKPLSLRNCVFLLPP